MCTPRLSPRRRRQRRRRRRCVFTVSASLVRSTVNPAAPESFPQEPDQTIDRPRRPPASRANGVDAITKEAHWSPTRQHPDECARAQLAFRAEIRKQTDTQAPSDGCSQHLAIVGPKGPADRNTDTLIPATVPGSLERPTLGAAVTQVQKAIVAREVSRAGIASAEAPAAIPASTERRESIGGNLVMTSSGIWVHSVVRARAIATV